MNVAIIINPLAGGVNKKVINRVKRWFGSKASVYFTSYIDSRFDIPGFDKNDFDRTVIVGGDGTLNDSVDFLLKQGRSVEKQKFGSLKDSYHFDSIPTEIAWIPRGTGNGYLRALRNPKNFKKSLETALEGIPKEVDVIHLEKPFDKYALNFFDIGAIAHVLHKRDKMDHWFKKRLGLQGSGLASYVAVIPTIPKELQPFYIEEAFVDNQKILEGESVDDIVIGKGFTPNHTPIMKILSEGELNDGRLRIGIYEKGDLRTALNMLFQRKAPTEEFRGKRFTLIGHGYTYTQADGNQITDGNQTPHDVSKLRTYMATAKSGLIKIVCQ